MSNQKLKQKKVESRLVQLSPRRRKKNFQRKIQSPTRNVFFQEKNLSSNQLKGCKEDSD